MNSSTPSLQQASIESVGSLSRWTCGLVSLSREGYERFEEGDAEVIHWLNDQLQARLNINGGVNGGANGDQNSPQVSARHSDHHTPADILTAEVSTEDDPANKLSTADISAVTSPDAALDADCYHLKGRGGIPKALCDLQSLISSERYRYVARSDAKGYYAHIRHHKLIGLLNDAGFSRAVCHVTTSPRHHAAMPADDGAWWGLPAM